MTSGKAVLMPLMSGGITVTPLFSASSSSLLLQTPKPGWRRRRWIGLGCRLLRRRRRHDGRRRDGAADRHIGVAAVGVDAPAAAGD